MVLSPFSNLLRNLFHTFLKSLKRLSTQTHIWQEPAPLPQARALNQAWVSHVGGHIQPC